MVTDRKHLASVGGKRGGIYFQHRALLIIGLLSSRNYGAAVFAIT
jgi:hypothetical protein